MDLVIFFSAMPLLLFGSITPGPNNALLSSSGMRFGFAATQPHALGIIVGHSIMEFSVALGLGKVYEAYPIVAQILTVVAVLLLIYLAYKIATAPVENFNAAEGKGRPWRFYEAALFQWINPKAWIIAIGVSGTFASGTNTLKVAIAIGMATIVASIISTQVWVGFGVAMARLLRTPMRRRIFNWTMAGLIIFSVVVLLAGRH